MKVAGFRMRKSIAITWVCAFTAWVIVTESGHAQNSHRWAFEPDGGIQWKVQPEAGGHLDRIEMSGLQLSAIVQYGVSGTGQLVLRRKFVFPMLRTIPNNTHASLQVDSEDLTALKIEVDGHEVKEAPWRFYLRGKLVVESDTQSGVGIEREMFPSTSKPAFVETITVTNQGSQPHALRISNRGQVVETAASKGVYGRYIISAKLVAHGTGENVLDQTLLPHDAFKFAVVYSGRRESDSDYAYAPGFELAKREKFVDELFDHLRLETPDEAINRAFAFAKLRAAESIYDTKGGLMHGPGGGAYYAAIWANDQAEYANPFFPFLGNLNGNESAINSFRHFARFINPDFKPIPSSIIAEGVDIWNGAGDRGDMAMIAYGASRFALAYGRRETAKDLWPLIHWCFDYLERKQTPEGVIASDSDELEGRFPAGKANLSTSSLAYGAYGSAADLANELGLTNEAAIYRARAQSLGKAIESYFGATVQGFNTYRYYDGNTRLRSWICLPLTMGITNRSVETVNALLSSQLWTSNGILTEAGSTTFWDRSTLYAFRGLFAASATDEAAKYFSYYSNLRLLGEHVPYPVEAWPEGDQRQLSAESALYCRAVTEGLFGITPTGFNRFTLSPRLPSGWEYMNLRNIKAFDRDFDIEVRRRGKSLTIRVKSAKGELEKVWNQKAPLSFELP